MSSDSTTHIDAEPSIRRVLIVEDSPEYAQILEVALQQSGYESHFVTTGEAGMALLPQLQPDLVILDLVLPGMDGVEVCRQIRSVSDAYIIMLTARSDEVDKIVGLAVGADDYVTKPFSPRELVARMAAMLRRPRTDAPARAHVSEVRRFGLLSIDPLGREVRWDDEELSLTRIEFDLLDAISSRPEMVHSRDVLLDRVWGADFVGDGHVVDVHIANLRKKIDLGGLKHLRTVRGVGYRMAAAPDGG